MEITLQIPLDNDGFRRCECPTCDRELKWLMDVDLAGVPGGPFCPYCGVQAPADSWCTRPQLAHLEHIAMKDVIQPELKRMQSRHFKVTLDRLAEPAPLTEDDTMRRVVPACHPDVPVKVLDEWFSAVHCSTCGTLARATSS
jgi:hypothetical protein